MVRKRFVVLGGDATHLGEPGAGYVGEVVVLVVVAHVEGEQVESAVVRVRFLTANEGVVFGDEVSGHGMQSHACIVGVDGAWWRHSVECRQ